jgi:hypothetical protein
LHTSQEADLYITCFLCWFFHWLFGRLLGWFLGWLLGWFLCWLFGWFFGWLLGWFFGWLLGWFFGWFLCWLFNCRFLNRCGGFRRSVGSASNENEA